jgi:hypothetical protein
MASRRGQPAQLDDEALVALGVLALAGLGVVLVLLRRAGLLVGSQLELGHLLASGWLLAVLRWLSMAGVVAGLALAALLALRLVCTWRTLRSRVAYAVLPPPTFEVRPETIEVFGQQLLGARRRVLAWLDRPACAIRIRLTTTRAGRVLYAIELPARFRGSLFNAYASAYPGVELRPLAELERAEEAAA